MGRNSFRLLDGKSRIHFSRGPTNNRCDGMINLIAAGGKCFLILYPQKERKKGFSVIFCYVALIVLSVIKLMASVEDITIKFATLIENLR